MIPPTTIQQPIPVITQAQIPVDSLRLDNHKLPQVPRPAQLFPTVPEKKAADKETARTNSPQSSTNPSVGSTAATEQSRIGSNDSATDKEGHSGHNQQNNAEAQQQIQQLASRDREVRAHERAHASVGGQFAGSPSFSFVKGPDGVLYATSGEVSISTGEVSGDPKASLQKLETVIRAALAPANPSSQDLRVAASASASAQRLKTEIAVETRELQTEKLDSKSEDSETEDELSPQQRLQQRFQNLGVFTEEQPLLELTV
jgi:uncharacterized protein YcbK (DUF882 family)